MSEKLVVGPISKGFKTNLLPFNIDNDSFPVLLNAYTWRGRVKRKRGTQQLGRLQRYLDTTDGSGNLTVTILPIPITAGISSFTIGTDVFVDGGGAGPVTLLTNSAGTGTLSRTTGVLTITGSQINTAVIYFPTLPAMGFRDLALTSTQFPTNLAFDTKYSYNVTNTIPTRIYDVSFYKNPPTGTYPGYVQKSVPTPTSWNGKDYQQFWTLNYEGALWATNGINIPFSPTNVGMQFKPIVTVTVTSGGPPAIVNLNIVGHGLVQGDFLFINEVVTTTGINLQTGYVTSVIDANNVTVEFPDATIATNGTGGIAQYLTNRSDTTVDCIRWYDGDPTNGLIPPTYTPGFGWVNFSPPLSNLNYTIADAPQSIYYLVGARIIQDTKDRLLFFGPVIQNSSGNKIYLQDTVIYSQNGTPFYTSSFTGNALLPTTIFNPILVPTNQTATAPAYLEDATGFGGFISAGIAQPITVVSKNEDVLIIGFSASHASLVYTGNDIVPFNFYIVNSELGYASTFSAITMDKGILAKGNRGFLIGSQVEAKRFDLDIPDQVFEINNLNNGPERICAQRDYINEWIYFTYNEIGSINVYPNQTLFYNYREDTWAEFDECYTCYGQFRPATGYTWATVGLTYTSWNAWNTPWNAGQSELLQPQIVGGNQQGFLMLRDAGTDEDNSLYIQSFNLNTVTSPNHCLNNGDYIIIDNCLGAIGTQVNGNIFSIFNVTTTTFQLSPPISSTGTDYSGGGTIIRMYIPFIQTKQFPLAWGGARKTRIGNQQYLLTTTDNGQITLQIYLSQDSSNPYNNPPIVPAFGSTNDSLAYSQVLFTCPEYYIQNCMNLSLGNVGDGSTLSSTFFYQALFGIPNSLVPGSVFIRVGNVATFTDNGNGGFSATGTGTSTGSSINYQAGIVIIAFTVAPTAQPTTTNFQYYVNNIQNPTSSSQSQIWHRVNTSLIGDTVQLALTMSDGQMRDTTFSNQFSEIELHGFIMDISQSSLLA